MYHNRELTIQKLIIGDNEYKSQEPNLNKTKIRFVELEIGDEFDYYGELLTKQNRYNATSVRNKNKKQYLFFGNEIVKVNNKKKFSEESNPDEIIINNEHINNEQLDGIDKVIENINFKKSSLNLIQASTGHGKTTFALHLASYFIQNNQKVLFLQNEASYDFIINKIKKLTKPDNDIIPYLIPYESLLTNIKSIAHSYDIIICDGLIFKIESNIERNSFKVYRIFLL